MTPGPNELKAALQRLIAGKHSEADREALRRARALNAGVLVTGDRAVAIGGNASDVIIITGDQNTVLSDAAAMLTALSSIAPTRVHEVPPPPPAEQIEAPTAAKVRAQLAAWREQTNT